MWWCAGLGNNDYGWSCSKLHHWSSHATAHWWHLCLRLSTAGFRAFDRFVNGQNHAGSLTSCLKSIDLNDWGLPDACLQIIGNIFLVDVDAIPYVSCNQRNEIFNILIRRCAIQCKCVFMLLHADNNVSADHI